MPSVFTIEGAEIESSKCKCTKNGRPYCFVGKSKKHPTGWTFKSGSCGRGGKGHRKASK